MTTECTVSISTEVGGYNSTHTLKVVINTNSSSARPIASVSVKNGPQAGHTIFAWLYAPSISPGGIWALLFVRSPPDNSWHQINQGFVSLQERGEWFLLTGTPGGSYDGSAILVGVQFHVSQTYTNIIVYVDNVAWT